MPTRPGKEERLPVRKGITIGRKPDTPSPFKPPPPAQERESDRKQTEDGDTGEHRG